MRRNLDKPTLDEQIWAGAKILANQLARANTHLHFFRGLLGRYSELAGEKDFWDYTLSAHAGMVIRDVGVVYDIHKAGINLIQLLRLVESKCDGTTVDKRLKIFLAIADKASVDPMVRVMRQWRNNIVAHYNNEIARADRSEFSQQNPLNEAQLQILIDRGFEIVEWCALVAGRPTKFPRFAPGINGHKTVLNKLKVQSGL
jgi:hypothetical protein